MHNDHDILTAWCSNVYTDCTITFVLLKTKYNYCHIYHSNGDNNETFIMVIILLCFFVPKGIDNSVSCQLADIGLHNQLSNEQKRCLSKQTRS